MRLRSPPTTTQEATLERIDELLTTWPGAHLLQSEGWGDVQAGAGWSPHRITVAAGGGRTLPLLLLEERRPALLARAVGTRLYVPRGPACAPDDDEAWEAALTAIATVADGLRVAVVDVEPAGFADDPGSDCVGKRLVSRGWASIDTVQPAVTALVDLAGDEDELLARMRPKARYNVRLARRRGVTAGPVADAAEAAEVLARLCAATAERQQIHQPDARHLRRVLDRVPGSAVVIARVEDEPVAGALIAPFAGTEIYLYGGSTGRHRERQPPALLHLEAMRLAAAAGCHSYDLWGIPPDDDPAHPWHGLRQFKLGLGGVERRAVGAWRWTRRPAGARAEQLLAAARRRARAVRRRGSAQG